MSLTFLVGILLCLLVSFTRRRTSIKHIREARNQVQKIKSAPSRIEIDHLPIKYIFYQIKAVMLLFHFENSKKTFKNIDCDLISLDLVNDDEVYCRGVFRFYGIDHKGELFNQNATLIKISKKSSWEIEEINSHGEN